MVPCSLHLNLVVVGSSPTVGVFIFYLLYSVFFLFASPISFSSIVIFVFLSCFHTHLHNSLLSTERNKSNHNFRLNQKLQWVSCVFLRDEQFWSFRTKGAILRNIYIHFVWWWKGDLYHKISKRGHCLQYFSMCVWHVEEFTLLEKLSLVPGRNPRLVPVSRPVPLLRY